MINASALTREERAEEAEEKGGSLGLDTEGPSWNALALLHHYRGLGVPKSGRTLLRVSRS